MTACLTSHSSLLAAAFIAKHAVSFSHGGRFILLRARFHPYQLLGASLIVSGAVATVMPSLIDPGDANGQFKWYACLLYWSSNVPMVRKPYGEKAHGTP